MTKMPFLLSDNKGVTQKELQKVADFLLQFNIITLEQYSYIITHANAYTVKQ